MTLAARRVRLACAVWLAVWATASGTAVEGGLAFVATMLLFDAGYAHARSLRTRPFLRLAEILAASTLAGYLLARLFIAAVLR